VSSLHCWFFCFFGGMAGGRPFRSVFRTRTLVVGSTGSHWSGSGFVLIALISVAGGHWRHRSAEVSGEWARILLIVMSALKPGQTISRSGTASWRFIGLWGAAQRWHSRLVKNKGGWGWSAGEFATVWNPDGRFLSCGLAWSPRGAQAGPRWRRRFQPARANCV